MASATLRHEVGESDSNNFVTRIPSLAPGHIIAGGHVIAACAVTAMSVAAAETNPASIARFGVVFFSLSFGIRSILFRECIGQSKPYSPSGVELSLGASALFVANAAASVATLTRPDMILLLIGYCALDVTANWLNMVASVKTPSQPRLPFAVLVINFINDAFVCSLIAGDEKIAQFTFAGFVLKSIYNAGLMVWATKVVINRDSKVVEEREKSKTS